MTNDKAQRVYRRLLYYFESKTPVYFKVFDHRKQMMLFRIGLIIDLSAEKETCVLKENVLGEIPILLEEINENTINTARARK